MIKKSIIIIILLLIIIFSGAIYYFLNNQTPDSLQPEDNLELKKYSLEVLANNQTFQKFSSLSPFDIQVQILSKDEIIEKKNTEIDYQEFWNEAPEKDLLFIYLIGSNRDLISLVDMENNTTIAINQIIKLKLGVSNAQQVI